VLYETTDTEGGRRVSYSEVPSYFTLLQRCKVAFRDDKCRIDAVGTPDGTVVALHAGWSV
jgi:hypothetical protein